MKNRSENVKLKKINHKHLFLLKSLCLQKKVFSEFLCLLHMERVPLALDDKHHLSQVYNKHREKHSCHVIPLICFLQGNFIIERDDKGWVRIILL